MNVTLTLSTSHLMALRDIVLEHVVAISGKRPLQPAELFVDVTQRPAVETTPADVLTVLMEAVETPRPPEERVQVGDRMRFSVELLREFLEQTDGGKPEGRYPVTACVKEVRIEKGGTKLLVLERSDT